MGGQESKKAGNIPQASNRPSDDDMEQIKKKNELFIQQNELLQKQLELMEKKAALEKTAAMPTARSAQPSTVSSTESGLGDSKSFASASSVSSAGSTTSESSVGSGAKTAKLDKLKSLTIKGDKYRILKLLGHGGFSKVYECLDPKNELRAIKCIDFDGSDAEMLSVYAKEVKLLSALRSTGKVIRIYAAEHVEADKMLYCVMERGDTDLETYFRSGKIDKLKMKFYWREMLLAVKTLHDRNIVHADLKPANFVLVGGTLKLIDLGLSRVICRDMTKITCDDAAGTVDYISPEAFTNRKEGKIQIGTYSDVWSLGCMLYAMLYGQTPFEHIPLLSLKLLMIQDPSVSIKLPRVGVEDLLVVDVLKKCLQRNPYERATIDQLLEHDYLSANVGFLGAMIAGGLTKARAADDKSDSD